MILQAELRTFSNEFLVDIMGFAGTACVEALPGTKTGAAAESEDVGGPASFAIWFP